MHRLRAGAVIGCLVATTAVLADTQTVTGRHVACGEPYWLEAALRFADEGPARSYERYIDTGRCIELRDGLSVEVLNYYGDATHRRVELMFKGRRYYVDRRAVAKEM